MKDFTISIYKAFLSALKENGFRFQTFRQFLDEPAERTAILRQDVDARKAHALHFAQIQHEAGIAGTYYFRIVPKSFDEGIIREVAAMGHEVGYHYEDMDMARGDPHLAVQLFQRHLERLRKIVPVSTICMHGSPRSKYDNRDLWKHYNYRDYGIVGEPYFDLDFREIFYLTDTGRQWDGHRVSVRDKVENHFTLSFHSTAEIISHLNKGEFPTRAMFNFHPQRWTDDRILWLRENYTQRFKNVVKYWLIRIYR